MNNPVQNTIELIELHFGFRRMVQCCNFNLRGEFILFCTIREEDMNIVYIYSTRTKSNKWMYQKAFKIPIKAELINISKYDKIWLRLNSDIHEWNILTGYTTIIPTNIYGVIIIIVIL